MDTFVFIFFLRNSHQSIFVACDIVSFAAGTLELSNSEGSRGTKIGLSYRKARSVQVAGLKGQHLSMGRHYRPEHNLI